MCSDTLNLTCCTNTAIHGHSPFPAGKDELGGHREWHVRIEGVPPRTFRIKAGRSYDSSRFCCVGACGDPENRVADHPRSWVCKPWRPIRPITAGPLYGYGTPFAQPVRTSNATVISALHPGNPWLSAPTPFREHPKPFRTHCVLSQVARWIPKATTAVAVSARSSCALWDQRNPGRRRRGALVATAEGRAPYETRGWCLLTPGDRRHPHDRLRRFTRAG
jgi:hypothetical protein